MLLMCMVLVLPMLVLPFMAKAGNKEVEISVLALPENGSDGKHLMCGSSLIFEVEINSDEVDKNTADIDWNVTKKDGTPMQAVYEVRNDSKNLEVYAPYGYSEELEVSVCVNGKVALSDTYTFETQENEKMVGKSFFQFDLGSAGEDIVCSPTTEVWNAGEKTYTITMPSVSLKNDCILFHGWKCSNGYVYVQGEKVTVSYKTSGFMIVSAWYDVLDEPGIMATKFPLYTEEPVATTGAAVTTAPAETSQVSATSSAVPQVTIEPAVSTIPEMTEEPVETIAPEVTTEPMVTIEPEVTKEPVVSVTPEGTVIPEQTAIVTSTPEVTKVPEVTGTPKVEQTPVATETPEVTAEPTATPVVDEIKTVSKVIVKKAGSRKVKVSWSKVSNVKGYRVAYSTNKNFKKNSTKYRTTTATKTILSKLTKKKTYYVKVCAYTVVDGHRVYGNYSNVKKITLK